MLVQSITCDSKYSPSHFANFLTMSFWSAAPSIGRYAGVGGVVLWWVMGMIGIRCCYGCGIWLWSDIRCLLGSGDCGRVAGFYFWELA